MQRLTLLAPVRLACCFRCFSQAKLVDMAAVLAEREIKLDAMERELEVKGKSATEKQVSPYYTCPKHLPLFSSFYL